MKWIYSVLAFIFVALFVSAITVNAFISYVDSGFEDAKQAAANESSVFANEGLNITYSQMSPEQIKQLDVIKSLSVDQKKISLVSQCNDPAFKTQPFCDSRFLTGQLSLDDVIKEGIKQQFENATLQGLTASKEKLTNFSKYHLLLVSIISGILSILFYVLAEGPLPGLQRFGANMAWLSFLSAVSFWLMPGILKSFVENMVKNAPIIAQSASSIMTKIMFAWLNPAISKAFWLGIWLMVIGVIIWLGFKFFRKYSLSVE